jgi:cell division protein FtsL
MTPPSAATAHTRERIRRGTAPRAPRRVSGPAARPRAAVAGGGSVALPRPPRLGLRLPLRRAGSLVDSRLLDRLLTGRVWIGFVAFALIGIVFMQVSLLKLNAGVGLAVEHAQSLERVNADLRAEVSSLGSNDRIQAVAERLGLELPPPGAVTFLGKDGKRMGGDGVTALAVGTQTAPVPAAAATTTAPTTTTTTTTPPVAPAPAVTTATTAATTATPPVAVAAAPAQQTTPPATAAGGVTPQGG